MKKVALPVFSKTQQPKIKSVLGLIFPDVIQQSALSRQRHISSKKNSLEKCLVISAMKRGMNISFEHLWFFQASRAKSYGLFAMISKVSSKATQRTAKWQGGEF